MSFSGFPKALSYAFDRMDGFSKITQRVEPNRTNDILSGSTIKVSIEPNTLWNTRSLSMYYDFTVNAVGQNAPGEFQGRYHPRLTSSIIDSLGVYMNNQQVDMIQEYGLLYNTIYDLEAGSEQSVKRFLEINDPSVKIVETLTASGATLNKKNTNHMATTDNSDIGRTCVINNWMNMFGNSGVEYLDTRDCGLTQLSIRLAPSTICFKAGADGVIVAPGATVAQYKLDNVYFTYSKIVFKNPLYENIKNSALMSEAGLRVKFTAYETNVGALGSRNINYQFNTIASSLDTIIATTRRADYDTENFLQLTGADNGNDLVSFDDSIGADTFNQSIYYRRDLSGLIGSQFFINGTAMSQRALTPVEVYNETGIALNNQNDLSNSSHGGLKSLGAFLKYYFAHILSLNYNGDTSVPTISGLNGGGASFNIIWKTNVDTVVTSQVYPVVYCASSRVLVINAGHQISVEI